MPLDLTQLLLDRITAGGNVWPPRSETADWQTVNTYRAVLESDRDALREVHDWPTGKQYRVDALPERIATAWADYIFGEDPTFEPANDSDADFLTELVDGELVSDLREAERRNSGEGEAWWRVYVDEDVADTPLLEWHSRLHVIPYYVGTKLKAAALWTQLEGKGADGQDTEAVWRHLEVHHAGIVEHLLFEGTEGKLGDLRDLSGHTETAPIAAALGSSGVWAHGLPMLMGRVYNRRGKRPRLGRSEFVPILDQLLDLNEAASIGASNMRLTAKKRMAVPEAFLTPARTAGAGLGDLVDRGDGVMLPATPPAEFRDDDLIPVPQLDEELGKSPADSFKVLEYSFDAEPLIAWKRDLVETALSRIGLVPQWVGVGDVVGAALSGTARRLLLVPTTLAGRGKARRWDDTLPKILSLMAQVDALPTGTGGFGRAWTDPTTPPSVERGDALPVDAVEDAQVESALVSAGVRSVETSIRAQHPDWTDDLVGDELERIKGDKPAPPTIVRAGIPPAPGVTPPPAPPGDVPPGDPAGA